MKQTAKIIINYKNFKPDNKCWFELEIKNAWRPVRQYADTPEIAFWKSIGMEDGLCAGGFNTTWVIGNEEMILRPSMKDFENIMKTRTKRFKRQ